MKKFILPFALFVCTACFAQADRRFATATGAQKLAAGHVFGTVTDAQGTKVGGATVVLLKTKTDSVSHKAKNTVVQSQVTTSGGEFSFENIPLFGAYEINISNVGFKTLNLPVSFSLRGAMDSPHANADNKTKALANLSEKDLGSIKLETATGQLATVTVTATKPLFEMGVDRKIFNVEKNIVTTGQTATELMKNIPGVNVDINGNVSLRNASPTLYLDGRPTTLTLDQIPADMIASVELITNPSAKFEASTGNAGIINLVMKKNDKPGYNGSLRGGIDSRGMLNSGAEVNIREKKINVFASAMYHERKTIATGTLDRNEWLAPYDEITQNNRSTTRGHFALARFGADYFLSNHNTLTFTQTFGSGAMNGVNNYTIDSLNAATPFAFGNTLAQTRNSTNSAVTSLDYKHTYTKPGKEWSGFITYNTNRVSGSSNTATQFLLPDHGSDGGPLLQQTITGGTNKYFTAQTDYTNPLTRNTKFEWGLRAALRNFSSTNDNYFFDDSSGMYAHSPLASISYSFKDAVYAGYASFSGKSGDRLSYQLGLRGESSDYNGTLNGKGESFTTSYPLSLFPSTFLTYRFSPEQSLQFNYSRRISRPSFFQLLPYTDYSNPQNLTVGNPALTPSFTNSFELNYNKIFDYKNSLLVSAYYKSSTDLITAYQYKGLNPVSGDSTVYNSYINANGSQAYGLELTSKNKLTNWWDALADANLYDASVNGSNIAGGKTNERLSGFFKLNNSFTLPANFSIQLSGDYQTKSVLPQSANNSGRGGNGGIGYGGNVGATALLSAQGYMNSNYGVDAAIRKDFGKNNTASVTLSVNDIFRTRQYSYYSETPYYTQTYNSIRDPQVFRLNFSYRFGKLDTSLFKRKNSHNTDKDLPETDAM